MVAGVVRRHGPSSSGNLTVLSCLRVHEKKESPEGWREEGRGGGSGEERVFLVLQFGRTNLMARATVFFSTAIVAQQHRLLVHLVAAIIAGYVPPCSGNIRPIFFT